MNKLKEIYENIDKNIIIIGSFLVIIILLILLLYLNYKTPKTVEQKEETLIEPIALIEEVSSKFYVDIKGEVKNPDVYEVSEGMIINDLIKLAGGLKKNATTKNINLSKKLTSEMLVLISNKKDLEAKEVSCNCNTNNETKIEVNDNTSNAEAPLDTKVSLNNATKEELMTLNGIGESKADSIIEYRNNTKFERIEDIMNISGIGESIFAKIKEDITL